MFGDVIRELKTLEQGVSIPISMPVDDDGHLDRRCPWDECGFVFKVAVDDWKDKVPDEAAYCPFCGHQDAPTEFNTSEQAEYIKQVGHAYVLRRLNQGMRSSAASFNRRPQRGFITLQMDVRSTPITLTVPPAAEEAMTLRISCEQCSCRFAVIGAAYFCPACGHNSADQTFDQSLESARRAINALPAILAAAPDRDTAAQLTAKLVGNYSPGRCGFSRGVHESASADMGR
jgi:rubrerythrin